MNDLADHLDTVLNPATIYPPRDKRRSEIITPMQQLEQASRHARKMAEETASACRLVTGTVPAVTAPVVDRRLPEGMLPRVAFYVEDITVAHLEIHRMLEHIRSAI